MNLAKRKILNTNKILQKFIESPQLHMLDQFMREKGHFSVTFVKLTLQKDLCSIDMLPQFMKGLG